MKRRVEYYEELVRKTIKQKNLHIWNKCNIDNKAVVVKPFHGMQEKIHNLITIGILLKEYETVNNTFGNFKKVDYESDNNCKVLLYVGQNLIDVDVVSIDDLEKKLIKYNEMINECIDSIPYIKDKVSN